MVKFEPFNMLMYFVVLVLQSIMVFIYDPMSLELCGSHC